MMDVNEFHFISILEADDKKEYKQHIPFLGLLCPIFDTYIQPCPILLTLLKTLHYNINKTQIQIKQLNN